MLSYLAVSLLAKSRPRLPNCALKLIFSYLDKGLWRTVQVRHNPTRRPITVDHRSQTLLDAFVRFANLEG